MTAPTLAPPSGPVPVLFATRDTGHRLMALPPVFDTQETR